MIPQAKVLIIEDERALALAFAAAVRQAGASSDLAATAAQARRKLREAGPFDALILDIGLPDENGLEFLRSLPESERRPTLVVTAHGDIGNAIAARKLGVLEFFNKPLDFTSFTAALASALKSTRLSAPSSIPGSESAFLGAAPAMRPVFRQIAHACASDEPVLLRGETGTGKTRVARLIRDHSRGKDDNFVIHRIGSNPLGESLTNAQDGILLVEDIAALPAGDQVTLLRGIESAKGGFPRLLATCSDDLADAVSGGVFRSDLYYRLQVLEVRLPRLRDRREDIPALADFFAGQLLPGRTIDIADSTLARLHAHDWPGNLRELRNVVSFALTAASGAASLEPRHLPAYFEAQKPAESADGPDLPESLTREIRQWLETRFQLETPPTYHELSQALEAGLLRELLSRYDGRLARLASALKANRATLRRRLRGHSGDE